MMTMTYEDTFIHYAKELLTPDEWDITMEEDIPSFGPTGIRKYIAEQSFEAFVMLYFSDEITLELPQIHRDFISDIQDIIDRLRDHKQGRKLARAIPRNHAKSTYFSRYLPLYTFLYNISPLTVLLANNDDAAKRLISNIKNTLESNEAIQQDFINIRGEYWGNEKLQNTNGDTIVSFGAGSGSIRGVSTGKHRPSLIVIDDIDDDRSVRSNIELANNKEWLDKTVMPLGDNITYTTSIVVVGTIIRKTSLMKYILDSIDFEAITESAVKAFSKREDLWQQWQDEIINSARDNNQPKDATEDTYYQAHKQEMLDGTQMLWDRPDAYRHAMLFKINKESAFWSELQNNPKDTDSTFGAVKYINIASIDERDYELLAVLDSTVKGNKNNDYASFVEVLFNRKRKEMIVSYADVEKRSYAATIDAVIRRIKNRGRKYDAFWIEENSAGAVIKDLLTERLRQERLPLYPGGIYSKMPKNERINMLSEYISRSQLFITDTLPDEAKRELESWPITQHDDFLDSVSICVLKLKELGFIDLIQI